MRKSICVFLCLAIIFSSYSYSQAQVGNSNTPYNEIIVHLEDAEQQALVLRKVIEGRNVDISERVNDIEQLTEALYNYLSRHRNVTVEELISFFHQRDYEVTIVNDTNPNYLDPYKGNGGNKAIVGYILLPGGILGVIITVVVGAPVWAIVLSVIAAGAGFGLVGFTGVDQEHYARLWGDEQDRILELIEYWRERMGLEELDFISIFDIGSQ